MHFYVFCYLTREKAGPKTTTLVSIHRTRVLETQRASSWLKNWKLGNVSLDQYKNLRLSPSIVRHILLIECLSLYSLYTLVEKSLRTF